MSERRPGYEPGGSGNSPRGPWPIQCDSAAACGIGLPAGAGLTGPMDLGAKQGRPGGACAALDILDHLHLVGSVPSLKVRLEPEGLGNNGVAGSPGAGAGSASKSSTPDTQSVCLEGWLPVLTNCVQ